MQHTDFSPPALYCTAPEHQTYTEEVQAFIDAWFTPSDRLTVRTSGSTGTPKTMQVEKSRMVASAQATCRFLDLRPSDTLLLCMPMQYIAAKMMVVRAIVGQLRIYAVTPDSHPLCRLSFVPTFGSFVPLQVKKSLAVESECRLLKAIPKIIIGGGAIDTALADQLRDFPHEVWSTYGMTETLSHIAMRRLNGPAATDWYTPLPHVQVMLSDRHTLTVHAPYLCATPLVTNDLAELNRRGQFRICGRADNTIVSGGIKIQLEQIEGKIRPFLTAPFAATSVPDPLLGEKLTLLTEQAVPPALRLRIKEALPAYCDPKIYINGTVPLTETGKIDRAATRRLVREWVERHTS